MVTRRQIVRALERAGRSADGLRLPRAKRIRRGSRTLGFDELQALARPALQKALAPCEIDAWQGRGRIRLAEGPVDVRVDAEPPHRSGRVSAVVHLEAGGRSTRWVAALTVRCPPPVVDAGDRVTLVVAFGSIRATAKGIAKQPGRVGETIRVQNTSTRSSLKGRIVDAGTVEVSR